MKIEHNSGQRIYFCDNDGFLDIRSIECYGVEIKVFDDFSFWAVVKTDKTYEPYKIVFFNNKGYFEDWVGKQKNIEIIYSRGKEKLTNY